MLNSERRTYKIRLIRPPVNDITESWEERDPDISKTHSELPVKTEEETISLDTKNPVYHAYTKAIEKKYLITGPIHYPPKTILFKVIF